MDVTGQLPTRLITITQKRSERIADKEIDRFSLILFDVRSAEVSAANQDIIDLIKPFIRPTSKVMLTGLTDRLGNATQNQILALNRARNVAAYMGVTDASDVRGTGNATTFAPDLPEGRLYTRTVDVVVETPVQP
jgi:outer membrane protein OmpA-like peptidoglycan-associated protein